MSCGCSTTYRDDTIAGMDETDMMLMGGAVLGYTGTAYVDNMLVYEKDGTKKTGSIAENDTLRNGGYVVGGVGLNWLFPDEPLAKGTGIGMSVFGIKELIRSRYPTIGIKGVNKREKYIANTRQQKYLGASKSSKIDLGLDRGNNQYAKKEKINLVINN